MTAPLHRVRLRHEAPLGTPLTSGTLFGHACWAIRDLHGATALVDWLNGQEESPWAISDGFPAGLLPRPLLAPAPRSSMPASDDAKKKARRPWVSLASFLALRGAMTESRLIERLEEGVAKPVSHVRLAHNRIDRRLGTTPEQGGLFFVDEDWSHVTKPTRDVYVRAEIAPAELSRLFGAIGESGFGRDATWGRGRFVVEAVEAAAELDDWSGNRCVSLSHGTITPNMRDARYKLFTHFGKLAGAMGEARVWKRPILLARPGLTFAPADDGPFGALLSGVHQDRPEIRHDARHVAIPYTEADE